MRALSSKSLKSRGDPRGILLLVTFVDWTKKIVTWLTKDGKTDVTVKIVIQIFRGLSKFTKLPPGLKNISNFWHSIFFSFTKLPTSKLIYIWNLFIVMTVSIQKHDNQGVKWTKNATCPRLTSGPTTNLWWSGVPS